MARFHADMDALEMRPPVAEPRATESIDGIIELVGRLLDSGQRLRQRTAPCTSTCRRSPTSASSRTTPDDQHGASSRASAAATPTIRTAAQPLDFVLWQPSLRRRAGVARAVRRRPPGLAHRVLGDGDARARPDARPARRRHRPHLPAPRVRDRAERDRSPASRSRGTGCTRRWSSYEGEKMSKSLGNLVFVSDLLKVADPRAIRLALHAPPLPLGLRVVRHRPRRGHRAAAPAARRGASARRAPTRAVRASASATRSTTTSTRRARSRRSTTSPSAILSGGDDRDRARAVLCELGALLGVDLDRPIADAPDRRSARDIAVPRRVRAGADCRTRRRDS